jgi:hypothetical protein
VIPNPPPLTPPLCPPPGQWRIGSVVAAADEGGGEDRSGLAKAQMAACSDVVYLLSSQTNRRCKQQSRLLAYLWHTLVRPIRVLLVLRKPSFQPTTSCNQYTFWSFLLRKPRTAIFVANPGGFNMNGDRFFKLSLIYFTELGTISPVTFVPPHGCTYVTLVPPDGTSCVTPEWARGQHGGGGGGAEPRGSRGAHLLVASFTSSSLSSLVRHSTH